MQPSQNLAESPAAPRRLRLADASLSAVTAGLVAVAVSYAGPLLVVLGAADAAGLSPEQTTSWVWAISVGSGAVCLVLSLLTRMPVVVAWSVPGAALLITALGDYSYAEAIGAYIAAGLLGMVLGVTGWFGKLLGLIPRPILSAVLAGVLLPFVLQAAGAVVDAPLVAGGLVTVYLGARRVAPRYAVLLALLAGVALAAVSGQAARPTLELDLSPVLWTTPVFSAHAFLGIAVPLLVVTMAGQNGPGLAMMQASGYQPNDRLLLGASSAASVLFAPFGSHAINLAAITAGICSGREAHEDPSRRYVAGVSCGVFFLLFGLLGSPIVALLGAVPGELITAAAGVALLGALQGAVTGAVAPDDGVDRGAGDRTARGDSGRGGGGGSGGRGSPAAPEAALITLAVTASGIAPLGIVAPVWGTLAGVAAYLLLRRRPR